MSTGVEKKVRSESHAGELPSKDDTNASLSFTSPTEPAIVCKVPKYLMQILGSQKNCSKKGPVWKSYNLNSS